MENKCPRNRRLFSNQWDELAYLCDKMHYHLYQHRNYSSLHRYACRIKNLLDSSQVHSGSIVWETACALVSEYNKCWNDGFKHREAEINLILKLYASFSVEQGQSIREYAIQRYLKPDVLARLLLITTSYEEHACSDLARNMRRLVDRFEECKDPLD